MKRRVLRWYDYSWSRGRIQGGGDINTALGLLPDKLKTELALHVNLSVLKKVRSTASSINSFPSCLFFAGNDLPGVPTGVPPRSSAQNEGVHLHAWRLDLQERGGGS